jgi:hypothetical protein
MVLGIAFSLLLSATAMRFADFSGRWAQRSSGGRPLPEAEAAHP